MVVLSEGTEKGERLQRKGQRKVTLNNTYLSSQYLKFYVQKTCSHLFYITL